MNEEEYSPRRKLAILLSLAAFCWFAVVGVFATFSAIVSALS